MHISIKVLVDDDVFQVVIIIIIFFNDGPLIPLMAIYSIDFHHLLPPIHHVPLHLPHLDIWVNARLNEDTTSCSCVRLMVKGQWLTQESKVVNLSGGYDHFLIFFFLLSLTMELMAFINGDQSS